jgi:hypothetical protein
MTGCATTHALKKRPRHPQERKTQQRKTTLACTCGQIEMLAPFHRASKGHFLHHRLAQIKSNDTARDVLTSLDVRREVRPAGGCVGLFFSFEKVTHTENEL